VSDIPDGRPVPLGDPLLGWWCGPKTRELVGLIRTCPFPVHETEGAVYELLAALPMDQRHEVLRVVTGAIRSGFN